MTKGCFLGNFGSIQSIPEKKISKKIFFSIFPILSKIRFFRISTFFVIFFQAIDYFREFWLFSSRVGPTEYVRRKKLLRSDFTLAGKKPEVGPRAQNRAFFSVKILLQRSGNRRRLKLSTNSKPDQKNTKKLSKIIMTSSSRLITSSKLRIR